MIICLSITIIIIKTTCDWLSFWHSFTKNRVCGGTQALFLHFSFMFNHFFRVFCSLSFNICHSLLPIFNNFGLIFFQIQSKSLLTTNFTTYLLTNFTTISANLSNISIRILLSWSIRILSLIPNMRFEKNNLVISFFYMWKIFFWRKIIFKVRRK